MTSEIGRELKVSELRPKTVVWVHKGDHAATMWVVQVRAGHVHFYSGVRRMDFIAKRTGPGGEQITDDSGAPMKVLEYLGEV
jgi:hypothetical protein